MEVKRFEAVKTEAADCSEEQAFQLEGFFHDLGERLRKDRQEKARRDAEAEVQAAMERARALCEKHGIVFTPTLPKAGKKAKGSNGVRSTFVPKAGHMYQHPDNSTLTCKGTGPRPEWWHALLRAGKEPKDLGPAKEPSRDVKQPTVAAS